LSDECLAKPITAGQRVDVDEHGLSRVGCLLVGLSDDGHHGLTDPTNLVTTAGEQRSRDRRVVVRRRRFETERLGCVDGDHTGHALGLGEVDVDDDAVRDL
jgi:hypothetical protein